MDIEQSAVKGEAGTGFEKRGSKGPFECGNCEYFKDGHCGNKIMMARSKQPKDSAGHVEVDAGDCCEYVERIGGKSEGPKWRDNFTRLGKA